MKKFILLFLLVSGFSVQLLAQQLTANNLYLNNRFIFNPARAGYYYGVDGFVNTRYQWLGIEDAPQLISFGLSTPVGDHMGVGLKFHNDKKGVFESFFAEAAYAYQLVLGEYQILTFGMSAGIVDRQIDQLEVGFPNDFDPVFQGSAFDETYFTVGAGLGYQWKGFKFDLAFPYLLEEGDRLREHFLALASYDWDLRASDFAISPSVMYRNLVFSNNQTDFNLEVSWKDFIWARPGYRTGDNYLMALGLNFKNIRIGYGYQQTNLDFAQFSHNTHEISVGFTIQKKNKEYQIPVSRSLNSEYIQQITEKMDNLDQQMKYQNTLLNDYNQALTDQQRLLNAYGRSLEKLETMNQERENIKAADQEGHLIEPVAPGYYVVISTFESEKRARKAVNMLQLNQMQTQIMYDSDKQLYYIYSSKTDDREEALYRMRQLRQSNLKETWILVIE
ncbi:MAG: PorP/SprF family type IX secretion system membrane protein [Candidatus Cyclobacteriaceae bacterium M3_2C_046]